MNMAGYGFLQASEEAPLQQQIDDMSEKDGSLTSERVFCVDKLSASSERKSQENVGINGFLDSGSLERKTHEVLGSSGGLDSGCSGKKLHENLGINGEFNPEAQMHENGGTNEVSYPYSQIDRMGLHGSVTGLATEPQSTPAFCIESEKHFTNGAFDIAPCNGEIGKDSTKGSDAISGCIGEDFCKDTKVMNGGISEGFGRDPMDSNGRGICGDSGNNYKGMNSSGIDGVSLEESSIPQIEEPRACSKQVESGSEKKRRSRWEPRDNEATETQEESSGQSGGKKRSRWAPQESNPIIGQVQLPDFFKDLTGGGDLDPEVQAMNLRLLDINQRLQTGQVLEEREDGMRSPSPEPIYDNMGIRINTREYRAREQLTRERQELICELIKKNPAFKAPADYRPPKLSKKLYIPMKEYPGYNFIGLIIGPRGNTQKRMQKETGAKIVIRGKGSIKEGRSQQKKDFGADCGENDDLHVYVEADNATSLEQAVSMVEKLLSPVDELQNEHKKAQLRELAALNGTMCENEICRLCGEPGHRHYMCPSKNSTFKSDVSCRICGDGGHPTIDCPVKNSTGASKMDDEYASFLAEVGGGQKAITSSTNPQNVTQGQTPFQSNPNGPVGGSSSAITPFRPGLGSMSQPHPSKEIDEANLYVGYLPLSVDDQGLINLFSPFGKIEDYKLIKDRVTGWSKGYGFVKFSDAGAAAQAVTHMNGYRLDGKVLAVRVAGRPPPPLPPQATPFQSNNTIGYSPHSNQPPPPMMSGNLMSSPPPWSIMPQAPLNPYGPPPGNNYFANPPPPGAQQGVLYPYPSGFMGNQPPPSGYMGGPIQGPPTNVNMNVNPNIPPVPGMMPTLANGISPEVPQYSQAIPQYSQEIPQYSQDYYSVPPPPPPPPSSSTPSAGVQQQQRGDVVETEYEKFMSEMRH